MPILIAVGEHKVGPNRPQMTHADVLNSNSRIKELIERLKPVHEKNPFVFIDGFLLYTHKECMDTYNVQIFLHAPFETLNRRRNERTAYVTTQGSWVDPPHYFEKVVWPEYLRNNKEMLAHVQDPDEKTIRHWSI
ncbi:ribosylnicotinamide kinase [Boothiomyces macroporosus]|uniref:Ribosylnicotinamide kinase n=1 Tax=Boothiomyces macroporosus TaxID=261099 RepID=A0AAD5UM40_9FUNG|nr:ribosylnicotinamide kinase [Boothiomyces macroporosus]KAJ3259183.1 ribosylnicotinamide kinase [Boothiomyces macroporosus]